jgi:pimeloyl-ACP methyl ester carboxylesterase
VTLVGNDTGGAVVQLIMADPALSGRVARAVLASCDAFGNFPPGLTGKALVTAGRLPAGAFGLFMQQMRWRPARRMPIAFGWLTKRGDAATARWLLAQAAIRQDTVRMLRSMRAAAAGGLMAVTAERLPEFTRPALVVWASEDRVMPPEHGKRLAGLLPDGRLAEVADSYTLMPLDQPGRLASLLSEFARPLGPVVVLRARGGHQ